MLYKSTLEARDGTIIPVFSDGRTMFSRYAPLRDAENFAGNLLQDEKLTQKEHINEDQEKEDGFFVVCGLGNGLHISSLKKKFPSSSILVIEKSPEDIQWLKDNFDLSEILSCQDIWITTLSQATETFIRLYNPLLHGKFLFLPLRSWFDQVQQEAAAIKDEIQQALKDISADFSTQAHFGKIWFRNFFLNLKLIPQVYQLKQFPDPNKYIQAFVAAAGANLENFIPDLKKPDIRKAVYLISTDTTLPVLLRHEIVPDMVVTIDGQASSARHFMKALPGSMVLAAEISCCPSVVRRCHEASCPILFFRNRNPLPALLDEYLQMHRKAGVPVVDTGAGTVTAAAVDLACSLGFTQIQVGGADFAYVKGKPYCRGTYFEDQFAGTATRTISMEQKYVELMFKRKTKRQQNKITNRVLESYNVSFQNYILNHKEISFIIRESKVASSRKRKSPHHKASPGLQSTPQIDSALVKGFTDWYMDMLLQNHEAAISSILPLYGWYLKKNNDKCDFFHIMKLAYSQTVRYTNRYGK